MAGSLTVGKHTAVGKMIKQILLEQFNACYDENGWFVAVRNAVDGLTAEQADQKPDGSDNSIREILSHLNYYNNSYLVRFRGENFSHTISDNDESFERGADWPAELERFDQLMTEWRTQIESADEEKFAQAVSADNDSKWAETIAHINIHNAYHGGQILLLRKLQGNWNAENGVS